MQKLLLLCLVTGLVLALGLVKPIDAGASGKMYWADVSLASIKRANLDGSSIEDLITTGLGFPSGLALDLASGKMYWLDTGPNKIQRANLDGSGVQDLVTTGLSGPRGIALWSCPGSVDGQALGFVDLRSGSLSYAIGDK